MEKLKTYSYYEKYKKNKLLEKAKRELKERGYRGLDYDDPSKKELNDKGN